MDGNLSFHRSLLVLHRAKIFDGRVPTLRVVKAFDIIKDTGSGVVTCALDLAFHPFDFER